MIMIPIKAKIVMNAHVAQKFVNYYTSHNIILRFIKFKILI
jgi:hypothetical protein